MRHHHHHWTRGNWRALWPAMMRLRTRVFFWIAGAIVMTAVLVGSVTWVTNRPSGKTYAQGYAGAQAFVGNRFADVWDNPSRRSTLLHELATAAHSDAELLDQTGQVFEVAGHHCSHVSSDADVIRDGVKLGAVHICAESGGVWKHLWPLLLTIFVLWAAAGRISWRMIRPMTMVIEVAEELGKGNLKSRAPVTRHRYAEERALAEALNRMADRIERQMDDQRELLAQVSHELRTPLGHLRILLELAREKAEGKTLDEMEKEITEIDALVGDLLASSRVTFEALTLRELSAAELAARALDRAGVPAEKLAVEGTPRIQADATLVVRALANLLENAREHGRGVEMLEVKVDGGFVSFTVRDRGPGFAEGDVARAFDPFFHRPRGENGDGGSLGLGLALVDRIAKAHGGAASARNREGGGAEVGFTVKAA